MALEKTYQKLQITDQFLHLSVPGETMGQTTGVALNSKGHVFVYSRTNPEGVARGGNAAMLFEFDPNGKFVKEWGPHNYAESFAHEVKVDKQDNVWMVDEGSGMLVKFDPEGLPVFWLGRTPEAIDYLESNVEHLEKGGNGAAKEIHPKGRVGEFNRPTDVAWDSQGDIFVSDGYGNSRVVKVSPKGEWLKELGTWGSDQDQFKTPHGIAADAQNNIYVADRGNRRIQVYDSNLNYERTITGVGAPWALCVSPSQFLFSGDGNGKLYKLSLDGKVLGWAQTDLEHGQAGDLIHSIACPSDNVLYLGSASMWDVQKITIH
jgi:DNA-binding beta-propeller fold protein YncE